MKQLLLSIVLIFFISACAAPTSAVQTSQIEITNAWVRAVGAGNSMNTKMNDSGPATALFMTIQNDSDANDTLLSVESEAAKMAQIHLSEVDANGVSSMHEVNGVEIPAGGSAELKPGGYHIMLMGLSQDLQEGTQVSFTLTFKNAGKMIVEAPVEAP